MSRNYVGEAMSRYNRIYLQIMQDDIDSAITEDDRVRLQKERDEHVELSNKNKTDDITEFV